MMADVLKRLRCSIADGHGWCQSDLEMLQEAADEIERLRAALREIKECVSSRPCTDEDELLSVMAVLRIAMKALDE